MTRLTPASRRAALAPLSRLCGRGAGGEGAPQRTRENLRATGHPTVTPSPPTPLPQSRERGARRLRRLGLFLLLFSASSTPAAPPTLTHLAPAGLRRGTTAAVTYGGTADPWPCPVWTSDPRVTAAADAAKNTLKVTAAADAAPGVVWLRLHNDQGASPPRPLVVGTLPSVAEAEPNDDPAKPQAIPATGVVVEGALAKVGDADVFAVPLKKGQTLVASVEAHRTFRSPVDAVLQVLLPGGFVLADDHDARGLDPEVAYPVPADGTYLVRLLAFPATPDTTIRLFGTPQAVYRLTVTAGGFADHAFPPAVERGKPATVALAGWNLPPAAGTLAVPPVAGDSVTLWHPEVANAVTARVEPHPVTAEAEPNGPDKPQPLTPPVTVGGRIDTPGDVDAYEVTLKKGQRLTVEAEARAMLAPLDPVLRLVGPGGTLVREADDDGKADFDPLVTVAAPADGRYRVEVRDLHGHGGPRYVYRLRLTAPAPEVTLALTIDRFAVTPGAKVAVPVAVNRREGFAGPLELHAVGLPAGVTAKPVTVADAKAKTATLELEAAADAKASGPFRVTGRAKELAGPDRAARAPVEGMDGVTTADLWLTVSPAARPPEPAEPRKKRGAAG